MPPPCMFLSFLYTISLSENISDVPIFASGWVSVPMSILMSCVSCNVLVPSILFAILQTFIIAKGRQYCLSVFDWIPDSDVFVIC